MGRRGSVGSCLDVLGLVWTGSFLWSRAELEEAVRTIAYDRDGLDDGPWACTIGVEASN
jgi:hypothetical protein